MFSACDKQCFTRSIEISLKSSVRSENGRSRDYAQALEDIAASISRGNTEGSSDLFSYKASDEQVIELTPTM